MIDMDLYLADIKDVAAHTPSKIHGNSLWIKARRKPFKRETRKQCKRWQAQSIRLLRATLSPLGERLAQKLKKCSEETPCASEACAHCMYEFRTRLFHQSMNVIPTGGAAVSIIPAGLQIPVGSLHEFDVVKHVRRLQKRIARSPLLSGRLIIGGLDISLEKYPDGPSFWQVHLYFLIDHVKGDALQTAVEVTFPKEPSATKPYSTRTLVDRLEAIGYSYKSRFDTHLHYFDEVTGQLERKPLRNFIPDEHRPELLYFLDSYSIGSRMILRGIRRHGRRLNLKVIETFATSPSRATPRQQ